jgi:hypothetical protein
MWNGANLKEESDRELTKIVQWYRELTKTVQWYRPP